MKNKKTLFIIIIVCIILATTIAVFMKPYNNVELNAGTIYYQSYTNLYLNVKQYVDMLETYNETKDEKYLEQAMVKLDSIRDSLWIFRLANQMDFRNTYINEKVVKTDFLHLENLMRLEDSYHKSRNLFDQSIEKDVLDHKIFEDIIHYNQLILSGLQTGDVGYNSRTKEFRVVIDDSKRHLLEEGIYGLEEILFKLMIPISKFNK